MIGTWNDQWDQLQQGFLRLEQMKEGAPGGSATALNDLANFFERSESLRDWVKRELGHPADASVDEGMKKSLPLSLAHDIAIKVKHQIQGEKPWSRAEDADVDTQSVTVFVQTVHVTMGTSGGTSGAKSTPPPTAAHTWTVSYTLPDGGKTSLDAVDLARSIIADWHKLLSALGLL